MFSQHFGLQGEPFSLSPDPSYLYASPDHAEALAGLRIALQSGRGLTTLIGEVGTGKTTLLHALLASLGPSARIACLSNTRLSFSDLLRDALQQFGVECASRRRADLLHALREFLERAAAANDSVALVIDEAQNLTADAFEDLRLLTNIETPSAKLLQIVLVGQPELAAILGRPEQRHLAERVAFHCRIGALPWRERRAYVRHRLACAGGSPAVFTQAARWLLLAASAGIPRRINVLGHTAMLFAFGRGRRRVTLGCVRAALSERRRSLAPPRSPSPARPLRHAAWAVGIALAGAAALSWVRSPAGEPTPLGAAMAPPAAIGSAESAVREEEPDPPPVELPPLAVQTDTGAPVGLSERGDDTEPCVDSGPSDAMQSPDSAECADEPPEPVLAMASPPRIDAVPAPVSARGHRRAETAPAHQLFRVRPGTTLSAVARRFYGSPSGEAVARIKAANPSLSDADRLAVGQVIRVPQPAARQTGSKGRE